MCAIFEFVGNVRRGRWGETHLILLELMRASVVRGREATGFAALTARASGRQRLIVDKQPLPANFYAATSFRWRTLPRCSFVLGHARYGPGGTGKTSLIQIAAAAMQVPFKETLASALNTRELSPVPRRRRGQADSIR